MQSGVVHGAFTVQQKYRLQEIFYVQTLFLGTWILQKLQMNKLVTNQKNLARVLITKSKFDNKNNNVWYGCQNNLKTLPEIIAHLPRYRRAVFAMVLMNLLAAY